MGLYCAIMAINPDDFPPGSYHELPLFPLNNVVLFPGMPLPLHIFEERYKAMIGSCIDRDEPFGVLLIREGNEVGDPAEPHSIGTTARVSQVQRLQEGRLNILTRGENRFELLETVRTVPHLVGLVRYIEDTEGEVSSTTVAGVREQYIQLQRTLTAMAGGWDREISVPDEAIALARIACATLAVSLPLPPDVRQSLLETLTAGGQLEKLLTLMRQANRIVAEQVEQNTPFKGPRLN
ncbi:MAG: LON peptidase substrate-binding domain-containing protein [Dehalococcoidia bacterium]|nr:LON peptidase substrate-binding domain-containing protein [Dehalococcoidia bacterium]